MMFSELLRKKREDAGLTRAELAISAGIALEVINDLEAGVVKQTSFDTCYKISRALASRTRQPFILQDLWCAARGHSSAGR
ncbi:MAG TPA: helix-turn-helix transcriptional regulator [Blastocatellia bacterium]|nr:helix-turn-helix transcriptional regulator [Blastocatellia bacterium]